MNDWCIAFSPFLINIFFSSAISLSMEKYIYIITSLWGFLGDNAACGLTVAITILYQVLVDILGLCLRLLQPILLLFIF